MNDVVSFLRKSGRKCTIFVFVDQQDFFNLICLCFFSEFVLGRRV